MATPAESVGDTMSEDEKGAEAQTDDPEAQIDDAETQHSRIMIKPDGEVVIENLSIDLMELLEMLDPDAEVACELPADHPAASKAEDS